MNCGSDGICHFHAQIGSVGRWDKRRFHESLKRTRVLRERDCSTADCDCRGWARRESNEVGDRIKEMEGLGTMGSRRNVPIPAHSERSNTLPEAQSAGASITTLIWIATAIWPDRRYDVCKPLGWGDSYG